MARLKTNIIAVAAVVLLVSLPSIASASENEKNHLYQEGFGNVDKTAPAKKANLKDDFSKFRAEGTYSRSRSLGLGYSGDGGSYGGGYSASDAAPRGQRLGASSSYGSQPRGRSRCRGR